MWVLKQNHKTYSSCTPRMHECTDDVVWTNLAVDSLKLVSEKQKENADEKILYHECFELKRLMVWYTRCKHLSLNIV